MVSRAEHARRTIVKLERELAKTVSWRGRRRRETYLAAWRQQLAHLSGDRAEDLQRRERGS